MHVKEHVQVLALVSVIKYVLIVVVINVQQIVCQLVKILAIQIVLDFARPAVQLIVKHPVEILVIAHAV